MSAAKADESHELILKVFKSCDLNGNGTIELDELKEVLQAVEPDYWTTERMDDIFKAIDVGEDDLIQFEELLAWLYDKPHHKLFKVSEAFEKRDDYFAVELVQLSGVSFSVDDLLPENDLEYLYVKTSKQVDVPRAAIKLMLSEKSFTPEDSFRSLESLGISKGVQLTFWRLPLLNVASGMRIVVDGAGSAAVNGVYLGKKEMSVLINSGRGHVYFRKEREERCISWYDETSTWPAGWYMENSHMKMWGSYFVQCSDMNVLPANGWAPYIAEKFSWPGDEPSPCISLHE